MTNSVKYPVALAALLFAVSPAHASSCGRSIARVQAQVDAAIERTAGGNGWKKESVDATRNYQPTPRSLARAEGRSGFNFQVALDSLDRARAADRSGDIATCRRELADAKFTLQQGQ
jgi:hypothetical protein